MLKDSLYTAIGLAVASLEQHLDFNAVIESTLVPEVQIQEPGYSLLRRRTAIVLGQWVPVKPGELNSNAIYQIFQHLLNKDDPLNDTVVRITAGRQLRNSLDPYEFSPAQFLPYAPSILQNLMSLVQESESAETKMGLLDTVRVAVVKMEDHVAPFSDQILSLLPPLWEASGDEHLMKQAILTLLTSLMHSLKQDSARYHELILPLISNSVEPGSDTLVYLLDEALELWSAVMMETPSPGSPELLSLLPALFPIFEEARDSAPQALQIAESYMLLAPHEVLSDRIRLHLLVSLEALLKSTTRIRLGIVPRLVEMMVRSAEAIDGSNDNTYHMISRSLLDSSFLASLLEGLHASYEVSQTTGPNRKTSSVYGVMETDYFSVLARLSLGNPKIFASAIAAATGQSEEQTLTWLLSEWFLHYDNVGTATQKKLHALALTQLLVLNGPDSQPPPYILNHLQSYLNMWTDIATELAEGSEDNNGDYLIYWNDAPGQHDSSEPPENKRRRNWENSDVILKIKFRDFVRQRLHSLIVGCGGEQRFQDDWLMNVDREVVSAFGAMELF